MAHVERRERILELLAETGFATVEDLSSRLEVSSMTIRRDLQRLEDESLLRRLQGGATVAHGGEPAFAERTVEALPEKRAIARAAAAMVTDGEAVILDTGTTALEVARQLARRRNLTVITNSLRVVDALSRVSDTRLLVTGGTLKQTELALVGPVAERMLMERRADIAFISASGFSLPDGATDYEDLEVAVKRAMIQVSRRTYLIVHSSKLGRVSPLVIVAAAAFDGLITDSGVAPTFADEVRTAGLHLTVATPAAAVFGEVAR